MLAASIPRNGLLRKDHYLAGFTLDLDDHVITVRRHGQVWERYGGRTDPQVIFHDIDQVIEMGKAVQFEAVS
jgi:hypothetical protein